MNAFLLLESNQEAPKPTIKFTSLKIHELDVDPEIDILFIAFCLFEDFLEIQGFVKDT